MIFSPRTLRAIGQALATCSAHNAAGNDPEAIEFAKAARELLDAAIRGCENESYDEAVRARALPCLL